MGAKSASVLIGLGWALLVVARPCVADEWSIFGRRNEKGSGDIISEKREVRDFERIRLSCSADLRVSFGDSYRVTVTTDDNLLDNIVTEVGGRRTLLIDSEGSFSTRRGVLVEITMPTLVQLEVDGSGDVEIAGLKSESLDIELNGSGSVEFDGEVKALDISIRGSGNVTARSLANERVNIETRGSGDVRLQGRTSRIECAVHGSGDIDAARMLANEAVARIYGSGDVSIYADSAFEGAVYGSGDIDLFGNPPDIDRSVNGSGNIRRRR